MLFLSALLPLLAITSARSIPSPKADANLDSRGLLDGLVGGLGQTVGNLGGTLGGVVGGLGNTVGGSVGGTVSGVGQALGGTVTTVGGTVVEVSKLNLDVLVNTCIRLGTATKVNEVASVGGGLVDQSGGITLAAGACVCVDAAASASLSEVSANVGVYASGGLYFNGTAAADIASSTQPGLLGLSTGVYNFDVAETCIAASVSLSNSHHDLQPVGGSCCARACNSGYVLTGGSTCCLPGSTLSSTGQCITPPTCTTNEILCNNQCYPKSSYTCPSGLPVMIQSKRSETCPVGMEKCSIGTLGLNQWECIDTKSDIESCGGCMYPTPSETNPLAISTGTDCTSLPGTNGVSCVKGQCQIQSCLKGFKLSNNGTSCEKQYQLPVRRSNRVRIVQQQSS
ncbi:hypothetical protein L486_06936 [Kwoniella mangroviensis CBS 10435]|uniref:Protein CPL1-like domain-containing protein n=1 Tax=Kwoniella mangroviensis CBS 10435 TaxID=1331196 RepID=A0A1B9IIZ8_9TREE|nr:hypothetical protein L486_06936 [Kwoniella mangroviensis CBS 10435]